MLLKGIAVAPLNASHPPGLEDLYVNHILYKVERAFVHTSKFK